MVSLLWLGDMMVTNKDYLCKPTPLVHMEGKATAVRGHPDSRKRMNPFLIVGILLIVMGIGTWFIGNLLWDYFWGLFPSTV
jgi:hypothetical protein